MKPFLLISLNIFFILAPKAQAQRHQMPVVNTSIGDLDYKSLNFKSGVYKKISGSENCLEGEFFMRRDAKTGRVFIGTEKGIFADHIDQKVKNYDENNCVMTYFNVLNDKGELENTEVQSCTTPKISNIRTLKVKFDETSIKYIITTNDPLKKVTHKTACVLQLEKTTAPNLKK